MRVTALLVAVMWFEVLQGSPGTARPAHAWLVPVAGLAAQLAFTAFEAMAAGALWRMLGVRVRWVALAPRLLVASAAETLAVSIAAGRAAVPRTVGLLLAGPRAAESSGPQNGAAFAFAALGLLALVRMLGSAWLQSQLPGANFRRALIVVAVLWLVSRLVGWWAFDLLQGRSFRS
jgi:hypothetical protein